MRREWIEILVGTDLLNAQKSPSMRREWIEINRLDQILTSTQSPSMRREWIEITSVHTGIVTQARLPPCGGSGLKCTDFKLASICKIVSLHAEGVD